MSKAGGKASLYQLYAHAIHTRTRWLGTLHALHRSPHAILVDYNAMPYASPTAAVQPEHHATHTLMRPLQRLLAPKSWRLAMHVVQGCMHAATQCSCE
jgi:hypothetical protein